MAPKKISYWWSTLVGLLSVIGQVAMFYQRFENLSPQEASIFDYLFFFLSGVAGGIVLVYFLNHSRSALARWIVVLFFLAGVFPSMVAMLGGGLFGPSGIVLLPTFFWFLITGIGFLVGRFFSRKRVARSQPHRG